MSSTGLMSCVRENSPPLEMAGSESGASSLPPNTADQQKRRRFHPLRNLRRIFRRRTLTNADSTATPASSPSTSSLSQMSSSTTVIAAAASPAVAAPAHTSSQSTSSYYSKSSSSPVDVTTISSTTTSSAAAYPPYHQQKQQQPPPSHMIGLVGGRPGVGGSCGVAIIPPFSSSASASGGFYIKDSRDYSGDIVKLKKEEIPSSTATTTTDLDDGREMTDYQRSFSEGRLVDSEFSRDALSQSHDSVFSESATASSLSIVLKAELFDVLRKRRNRPDASDEDLGLPRSPTTPQRKEHNTINQSEGSLSLLSMASSDMDDESSLNCGISDRINISNSSRQSQDFSRTSDELDFDISAGTRLSHSAARHKMAIRPKKKGPTRHRRPIESTVLPSTPEVNEDMFKLSTLEIKDPNLEKMKSASLPPGVNAKILEQHSTKSGKETSSAINIKRSKTETTSMSSSMYTNKNIAKSFDLDKEQQNSSSSASTLEKKDEEGGFFKRLLHRNSKKVKKNMDGSQSPPEMGHQHVISTKTETRQIVQSDFSYKIEETRMEIRKEIMSEAKSGLGSMLNTFILSPDHERPETLPIPTKTTHKPKSGPAARQRIVPKDLTEIPMPVEPKASERNAIVNAQFIETESAKSSRFSSPNADSAKSLAFSDETDDVFYESTKQNSTELIRTPGMKTLSKVSSEEIIIPKHVRLSTEEQSHSMSPPKAVWNEHFEKRERTQPKIIGLSPFQQKIARADPDNGRPTPKPRKSVEKSKSFRYYSESSDAAADKNLKRSENMPSLPDLSLPRDTFDVERDTMTQSLHDPKKSSMGFEINDNNLIKLRKYEEPLPLSQGIYTKNIILTTSKPSLVGSQTTVTSCSQNITEIEENIDKLLVKSPFVTCIKKADDNMEATKIAGGNISITEIRKTENYEKEEIVQQKENSTKISEIKTSEKSRNSSIEKLSRTDPKPIISVEKQSLGLSTERLLIASDFMKAPSSIEKKVLIDSTNDVTKDEKLATPTKARRSSSIYEKTEGNTVPEFMKIQLNRVDSGRPKSHIVLSKNVKETDDKETIRRFSNESVEITDNKPPLPPEIVTTKRSSITSLMKVQDEIGKSPIRKIDEENNVLRNTENITQSSQLPTILPTHVIIERRKSVTDEKLKYEKKIEELKSERKKSTSEDGRIDSRKSSIDEENGVVLRKKSFGSINKSSTGKEDTPELMKVFARRSLKIKDTDEIQHFEESDTKQTSSLKRAAHMDSDKENQSSSEEKLDKLPKVEITIQSKTSLQNGLGMKIDDKNRDLYRKPNTSITSTPVKSYVPPTRFGNVTNYRNTTTSSFVEIRKTSNQTTTTTTSSSTTEQTTGMTPAAPMSNANEHNNNSINSSNVNNNNNNKGTSVRHTIGPSSPAMKSDQTEESEFKGILQRRAEWEKRAKEAASK